MCVGCSQKLKKAKQAALHKTPSKSGKKLLAGSGVSPLVNLTKLKPDKKLKKSTKLNLSSASPAKLVTTEVSLGSNPSVPIGVGGITIPVFDPAASDLSRVDPLSVPPSAVDVSSQGEEQQLEKPPQPPKEPPVLPESLLPPDVLTKVKDLEEVNIIINMCGVCCG